MGGLFRRNKGSEGSPSALRRSEASKALVRDHLPGLLKGAGGLRFALLRDAFPIEGGTLPYDAALQIGCDEVGGLASSAASLEKAGWTVAAVRTRRHETAL